MFRASQPPQISVRCRSTNKFFGIPGLTFAYLSVNSASMVEWPDFATIYYVRTYYTMYSTWKGVFLHSLSSNSWSGPLSHLRFLSDAGLLIIFFDIPGLTFAYLSVNAASMVIWHDFCYSTCKYIKYSAWRSSRSMAVRVVEFSNGLYKIRKIFA